MLKRSRLEDLVPEPARGQGRVRVVEVITLGGASAAMYRLQEVGDVMVVLYAALAIVVLTIASALAQAAEDRLNAMLGVRGEDRARRRDGLDDCDRR